MKQITASPAVRMGAGNSPCAGFDVISRRRALRALIGFVAASPLLGNDDDLHGPVNVHEFEEAAKRKMNKLAYDFIAGGVEDEQTLRANREAFSRVFIVPRVMRDVSDVNPRTKLLGLSLEAPIIIAPTGGKNLVMPGADEIVAKAALASKTPICTAAGTRRLMDDGEPLDWWTNTTGQPDRNRAVEYARRVEDQGAKAIVLTADNPYQSNRDRNNRNRFDYGYMQGGVPKDGEKREPRTPATPVMWKPHVPNLTWSYIDWVASATKLPVIVKGVMDPEDGQLAVQHGAAAISVSNHGGRQLDGAIGSLDALPDVVEAVGGKIPVLMDGGIRRGSDILKAMALGAQAILVGRAPLWGLGAFGQPGVERVLWMLGAEFKLAMALSGIANVEEINRKLVRRRAL